MATVLGKSSVINKVNECGAKPFFAKKATQVSLHTLQQLQAGALSNAQHLQISCGLTHFPEQIFDLADTLEILDLSGNQLSSLPNNFAQLHRLKILFASDNLFTTLPEVLGACPQLEMIGFKNNQIHTVAESALPLQTRWLILTNNQLTKLPESIGRCYRLQKLALAGNQLESLPITLANCTNLGLLRIAANKLQALPSWLLQMPALSWLAFAGNPFCYKPSLLPTLPSIHWQSLSLQQQLGQGASGIISKAIWQQKDATKEVAIKVFKGAVTSDGLPEDEMNACILAGEHPNLVQVLGKLTHHPEQKEALVLNLIPSDYSNLGLPPSYASCTRDVFAPNTQFRLATIIQVVQAAASVAAQLHSKGIMHGDLYAHNILLNKQDHCLLGDFGAASLYDCKDVSLATALEKIEVSAWGCLLDDLLTQLSPIDAEDARLDQLLQCKAAAMQTTVTARPNFDAILSVINQLL